MADFAQVSSKKVSSFTAKNAYDDVFGGASKHGIPTFSSRVEDYTDIFSARNFSSSRVSSIPFLDLPVVVVDETNDVWSSSKFDYSEIFGGGLCHSVDYAIPYEELFLQPKSGFPAEIVSPQEVSSEDPVCSETNEAFSNLESHYAYDCGKQFNVSYHKTNQVSNEDGISGATHITQLNAIPAYTFVVDETLPLHTAKCDISLPEVANHKSLNGNTDLRRDGEHFGEDMSPQPACGSAMKSQKNFDGKGASDKKPFPTLTEVGLKTHPTEVPPPSREPPKLIIKKGSHKLMSSDVKYSTKYSRQSAAAPLSFDVDIDSSSSAAASVAAMKEAMEIAQVRLKSAKELMERKKDGLQNRKKMDMKDTKGPERSEVKITHDVRDKEVNSHLNVQRKNSELKGSDMKEHRLTQASDQEDIIGEWKAEELFYELVKKDTVGEVVAPKHKKSEGNSIPTTRAYEHDKNERLTFDQQEENYERPQAANRVCESLDKKRPIEAMEAYEKANHEAKVGAAQRLLDREKHEQRQKESHELKESEKKLVQEDHEKTINETHEQETKEACDREEHERKLKLLHEQEEHERRRKETFEQEEKMKEALRRKDDERRQREAHERGEKERKQMAQERRQKEMREKEEIEKKEDEKRQEAFQRDENERRQNEAREIEENAKRIKESYESQEIERRLKQAAEEDERRLKQVLEVEENQRRQKEACAKEENEKIQQALQREENDRRQQEARKIEENEKRLKESHERQEKGRKLKQAAEEDERRLKQIIEMEEIQSRQKEHEREENEKRLKESHETEQNERKLRQAAEEHEREENEKRLKESFEREENELKLKRTAEEDARRLEQVLEMEENQRQQKEREREENQKRLKECHEKEENERKLKQSTEENERKVKQIAEENEMRLREVIERIHTGEHESEETEKRLKESSEKGDNKWKRKQPTVENERIVIEVHEQEENEKRQKEILGHEDDKRSLKEYHSDAVTEKLLQEEACESAENEKKLRDPQELNESKMRPEESHKWEEKDKKSEEASCQEEIKETHNKAFEWEEKEQHKLSQDFHVHNEDKNLKTETVFEEMAECEEKLKSGNDASLQDEIKSPKATCGLIQEPNNEKLKVAQALFEKVKVEKLRATNLVQSSSDLEECKDSQVAASMTMADDIEMKLGESEDTVSVKKDQVGLNCKDGKRSIEVSQRLGQCSDDRTKFEAVQLINEEGKRIKPKLANEININQERKADSFSGNFAREASVKEGRMLKDKELEKERLRKLEEHKDREREREKDRVAVERVTHEARERAFAEARERAERAAVERATAEARQRAMIEARERLEKACAEAREKSLAEKAYTESRLRAERAAVERATAEARERAVEKAISERAAMEGRERVERSVSEKFSAASRDGGLKQTSSFSDIRNAQFQSSSTFSSSQKYPKSSNHGASNNKAQETEVESAQRCKARLERHQRTVERSVKALAEKNLLDNLAQRELAEKNRLGEVLDADVKRWSSGKEGNLRALLSTLQYILGSESGWQPIPLTDIVTAVAVKKAYRKATLCVHPDKLQQRGASIQQKYVCEKVFDLLKDAWTKFNSEER